jgi:hypothetical protein
MKSPKVFSMPWDMVVFLSITGVGFGLSMHRLGSFALSNQAQSRQISSLKSNEKSDEVSDVGRLLDLGCLEEKLNREKVSSALGSLRLKGKFCSVSSTAMRNFGGATVMNLTSGREATVFLRGTENSFVTDSLGLVPGKNEIVVEWRTTPTSPARKLVAEVFEK